MDNDIYYEVTSSGEEAMIVVAIVFAVILGVIGIMQLLLYIFRSMSLYRIAARRKVGHAWLAWVPVGWNWTFGSLADQYQNVVNGKKRYNRIILLVLNLGVMVLGTSQGITSVISLVSEAMNSGVYPGQAMNLTMALPTVLTAGLLTPLVSVACFVYRIIVSYDVYRSCDTGNGLIFTILGAIFDFLNPFFLFACRNKDEGMPGASYRTASNTACYKGPEL